MPPKRAAASSKKAAQSPWHVSQTIAWLMVFTSMTLATLSVCMLDRSREIIYDLRHTVQNLQMQKSHTRRLLMHAAQKSQAKPMPEPKASPLVLTSAKFREGELETTQLNLVNPLLKFYADEPSSHALTALLVERKNAASKDVSVRLFFADGTDTSYLWPSTNAKDGVWTPPCARNEYTITDDLELCPMPDNAPTKPMQQ